MKLAFTFEKKKTGFQNFWTLKNWFSVSQKFSHSLKNSNFESRWFTLSKNEFGGLEVQYCAAPLCPFDLLPSPKLAPNHCGANHPHGSLPFPPRPLRRRRTRSPWRPFVASAHAPVLRAPPLPQDAKGAEESISKALAMQEVCEWYLHRGTIRSTHIRDHAGALRDFQRAMVINPRSCEALINQGVPPPAPPPGQRHGQQPVSGTADPRSSQTGQVIRGLR